jgi:uncharacterized protein
MTAYIINGQEFCRLAQRATGTTPVATFARLCDDLHDTQGELSWTLQGGHHPEGMDQLTMTVSGEVSLVCQRCLTPFTQVIDAHSRLVLVADEVQAEELEQRLDDESVDVIVGSSSMDLLALVEDEALLALPLSPRHEVCPEGALSLGDNNLESPFAVLNKLKQ